MIRIRRSYSFNRGSFQDGYGQDGFFPKGVQNIKKR